MLEQLKRLDIDRISLEEMLALAAFAKSLHAEYDLRNIPSPEWLDDKIRLLNREIGARSRDALEMRLREVRAQQTQLLTPAEKRAKLAEEEARLQAQLGTPA